MASKSIYSVVAAVGIAAVAGGAYWHQNKTSKPTEIGSNQSGNTVGSAGAATNLGVSSPANAASAAGSGGAGAGAAMRGMPGVEVAKVEVARLQDDAQAVGSLRSKQNVMLRPEVSGRITQLGFTDGGRLRKGDLVVQLDDALQRAEIRQSEAQVSIARANYKRNQELVAQNFVAQRVLDESSASMQVAEAQLSLSCARWERMRVIAPFDGTVGIRNVNLGDYVKDGADLVNLEDLSSMFVDFRLPERFVGKLRKEQGIELQLDAMPGRLFKAKIEAIDPQLDANGRAVLVRAVLPNTGGEPMAQRPPGATGTPEAPGAPNSGTNSPKSAAGSAQAAPKKVGPPAQKPAARPASVASAAGMSTAPRTLDPIAASCAPFAVGATSRGGAGAVGAGQAGQGAGGFGGGRPSSGGAFAGGAGGVQVGAQGSARSVGAGAGSVAQAASQSTGQAPQRPSGSGGAANAGGRPGGAPSMGGGGGPLRPGMFARVTAVFNVKNAAITIPEEAIVPQGGRQFVIRLIEQTEAQAKEIADKQAADTAKLQAAAGASSAPVASPTGGGAGAGGANQPYPMGGFVDGKRLVSQRVDVRLGIRRPGRVEVLEGLTETDTVVIAGQQRVQRDNTPVRVIEMGRPPGGAGAPAASNASPSSPVNATNSVASPAVSTSRPAQ